MVELDLVILKKLICKQIWMDTFKKKKRQTDNELQVFCKAHLSSLGEQISFQTVGSHGCFVPILVEIGPVVLDKMFYR